MAEQPQNPDSPQGGDPMAQLKTERDDLLARLQRVSADYLNYQKRAARDVDTAREFANESLLRSLLPVLDDMERAIAAARANHPADDPLLVGVELVHDKALQVLEQFGVKVVSPQAGEEFNPSKHSALMQRPSELPARRVLEVLQKGYELRGRTLRPASVVVSADADETEPDQDTED
jgi:molecular chaperone GrpE